MKSRYSGSDASCGHRGCCSIARIGATRNLRDGKWKMRAKPRKGASTTVTAVVGNLPQSLSAARVAAPSREETARKMRFRIAKHSINRN
jgi:hypothetical protein